jgi:hypothetical protein
VNSITKYVVASQPVDTTAWEPAVVITGPDLLDEYRICTSPVIKGGGEPLFRPASKGTVELLDTKPFATGAVMHAYRPTSDPLILADPGSPFEH